jgi:hypothetical protein
MTEHDCLGRKETPNPIAMGSYTMDSHNTQRFITEEGYVQNEGDIGVSPPEPYQIAYGSIVPKQEDCTNLLVPAAMSASHIAYGSIRMEPVFMMLGHAAGTGAVHAMRQETPVQQIDYTTLRKKLRKDGMVLNQSQAISALIDVDELDGHVVDTEKARVIGDWSTSNTSTPYVGPGYLHDGNTGKGQKSVRYTVRLPEAGRYQVRLSYSPHGNRATNAPVAIQHANGKATVRVDQTKALEGDRTFVTLGMYRFDKGEATITLTNKGTDGYVVADAVQLLPATK